MTYQVHQLREGGGGEGEGEREQQRILTLLLTENLTLSMNRLSAARCRASRIVRLIQLAPRLRRLLFRGDK